jgi:hypothetical protein
MIRLRPLWAAAAALLALAHPAAAQGRDAQGILREAGARARARTQGVQNYTLNTKTMGMSLVSYVSRGQDGLFQVQTAGTGPMGTSAAQMTGWADELLLMLENGFAEAGGTSAEEMEAFTYEGVVSSGGAPAHRISASFSEDSAASGDLPRRFAVDFDTATLVTRRVEAEMTPGEGMPGSMLVELGDWRTVGGMLLPFRRHMVIRGMRAQLVGADTASAAQELAQGRAMLATLPEDQRETMRQMLEMMEGLLKRDEMVLDEVVVSVTVNQGPPPGLAPTPGSGKSH